jgi:hypothetical protein
MKENYSNLNRNNMLVHSILLFIIMTCLHITVSAQTTLSQGDVSIVGFNANSPDGFAFVTWVNISAGTVIKFTDNGFNSTASSNTAGNYREQEQYVVWTSTTAIPAGTIITIQANSATAPTGTTTNVGSVTSVTNSSNRTTATNMSLTNTSGDQVFAFQGTGGPSTGLPTGTFSGILLFGLDYSGSTGTATSWVTTGAINGSTSYLPGDLSGTSQIFLGPNIVAGQYTGPKSTQTSLAAYKALVANPANWTNVGSTGTVTFSTTAFSVLAPSITAQPSNSSICAGINTTFSITASNATSYQWQVNTGSGFVDLSSGAPYSGVTSATLTIASATTTLDTYQYQCVVTGPIAPNATSNAVILTVNALPTAIATPSSPTICSGTATNIALTSTPTGASFAWTAATASGTVNGKSSSSGTSIAQTLTGNGTVNYTVTPTLNSCVGSPITVAVTVNPNPTAAATPSSATICSGTATNIALTSTPTGASFAWTAATASGTVNGTSASSGTSIAQTLTGNGTTNYTVTPTLNSCTGSPITVAVTVKPNPAAAATPSSETILSGSATNIALTSAPTGASFAWTAAIASGTVNGTSASSGTSIAQTLTGNGVTNYTVTPILNSCTGLPITVAITVNPGTGCYSPQLIPNGTIQTNSTPATSFCAGGNGFQYYADQLTGTSANVAINPNGNETAFNAANTLITIDDDASGIYSSQSGSDSSHLMKRTVTIIAPGSYTINGGIKVRIYYDPTEKNSEVSPTNFLNSSWFKLSGTKSNVLAALTAGGISGATYLTPDSSDVENGVNFVQFNNITSFSTFGFVGSTFTVLPVRITSFVGTVLENCNGSINWTSAVEENINRYELESSTDGRSWTTEGSVVATGKKISELNYYKYPVDIVPGVTNFFKLKIISNDNTFTYSSIISLKCNNKSSGIFISPNPSRGKAQLREIKSGDQITVITFDGRQIFTATATNTTFEIDAEKWPAGIYLVKVAGTEDNTVVKMVVEK